MRSHYRLLSIASTALIISACSDDRASNIPVNVVLPPGVVGAATEVSPPQGAEVVASLQAQDKKPPSSHKNIDLDRFNSVRKKANDGDHDALYTLATMHLLGIGGAVQDREAARNRLVEAANSGSMRAMKLLAAMTVHEDRARAIELYEKVYQDSGDRTAQRHLAKLLAYEDDGYSLTANAERLEKAKAHFNECAAQGDTFAAAALGEILLAQEQPEAAVNMIRNSAMDGFPPSVTLAMKISAKYPALVDPALLKAIQSVQEDLGISLDDFVEEAEEEGVEDEDVEQEVAQQ